jgi:hypothetical protein
MTRRNMKVNHFRKGRARFETTMGLSEKESGAFAYIVKIDLILLMQNCDYREDTGKIDRNRQTQILAACAQAF